MLIYPKIILTLLSILVFFALFCIVWLENVWIQAVGLMLILALSFFIRQPKRLWKLILSFSPFFLMLALIYFLLGLFGFGMSMEYWLHYGSTRTMLLASSLLYMQIAFRFLNLEALLELPLPIHSLKYIILGKHLYEVASTAYSELCVFSDFMPMNQAVKQSFMGRIRIKLVVILALVSFVISEATIKGEMIDERIRHCWPERN